MAKNGLRTGPRGTICRRSRAPTLVDCSGGELQFRWREDDANTTGEEENGEIVSGLARLERLEVER